MTKKDEYLKDEVDSKYFATELYKFIHKSEYELSILNAINTFLDSPAKPRLIEDEKAILRNLIKDKYIARDKDGDLLIFENEPTKEDINFGYSGYLMDVYNHLFPFIKKRRNV